MKTFKQYITEENVETVVDHCSEYLKEIGGQIEDLQLYRGLRGDIFQDELTFKEIHTARRPLDTPKRMHEKIDNWFEKEYGIRIRSSSAQCTPVKQQAENYGAPHVIFPVNGYKAFYNPDIGDFTASFQNQKEATMQDIQDNPEEYSDIINSYDDYMTFLDKMHSDPPQEIINEIMDRLDIRPNDIVDALEDQINEPEINLVGKGYYAIHTVDSSGPLERMKEIIEQKGIS